MSLLRRRHPVLLAVLRAVVACGAILARQAAAAPADSPGNSPTVSSAVSPTEPPIPPLPVGSQVDLVDGGVIAGRLVSCDDAIVVVESLDLGLVRLPRRLVSGWRASLAADRDRSQRPVPLGRIAREMLPAAAAGLLLDNDDIVAATAVAIEGAAARIGIDGVAEPVTIPLERIRAIAVVHGSDSRRRGDRGAFTLVALRDGSRLAVEPLRGMIAGAADAGMDSSTVRLTLASHRAEGLVVACPREAVVAAADRHAGVRSLEHEEIAGHGGRDPGNLPIDSYVPSRSLSGGPLRARGENAFGGFSMQAPGKVIFVIRERADRFEGRVAIDDSAGQGGTVRVKLRAKAEGGKRTVIFESGPIRGGEMPLAIAADAPGMKHLEIELEAEGDDWKQARVVWLDPVVIAK